MRKRKDGEANSESASAAEGGNQMSMPLGDAGTPAETGKIEAPALVPSERANADAGTPGDMVKPARGKKLRGAPAASAVPVTHSLVTGAADGAAATGPEARSISATRAMPLAASIALAAVLGATAGALATASLAGLVAGNASPGIASTQDMRALKESLVHMNTEMVSLKAAIGDSGKTANAQFAKFGERLDRFERAQAEPAARLAKITEAIERRPPSTTSTAASETTASLAAFTPPPAAEPARPAGPPIVDGWALRGVSNGAALIQGRLGIIAVEPGDHLPGLGRIENIRRQDGRWVVVTTKGLIVTR
jgi:hypothetical protein